MSGWMDGREVTFWRVRVGLPSLCLHTGRGGGGMSNDLVVSPDSHSPLLLLCADYECPIPTRSIHHKRTSGRCGDSESFLTEDWTCRGLS